MQGKKWVLEKMKIIVLIVMWSQKQTFLIKAWNTEGVSHIATSKYSVKVIRTI